MIKKKKTKETLVCNRGIQTFFCVGKRARCKQGVSNYVRGSCSQDSKEHREGERQPVIHS